MTMMTEGEYRYNMLIKEFPSAPTPAFETPAEQARVWGRHWGCSNDVGALRLVLMHRPGDELKVIDERKRLPEIGAFGDKEHGWYWRGDTIPDIPSMQAQHDGLVQALREEGTEIVFLDRCAPERTKACYTRDSVIAVDGGAIVTRLGPPIRRGEEAPVTETLARIGMPILRTIHGTGILEGGSFAWINPRTAVVGVSSRVNEEGVRQLAEVLRVMGVELLVVQLTGYRLHIDGMFVMIDGDTALINPTLLPFWFLEKLKEMNVRTIEVCHEDAAGIVNCLAVRPGRLLMPEGVSDRTREKLDRCQISIRVVPYDRMSLGGGGIHCSTGPLIRDPV
ncbi:MAG: amidinotransferase [Alphaproteobacteria bacterium]|nr:amidinotransferase [Alphaproteobacteria bacterium]